ncbi:MAG TPA: outer membrane lipid asymmetry maintenance protein MlaD [Rhodobacteraceae bacterium]|jgi:phospholipid/cholesterol/gamma-HCH transport system substrate-binding protein|nr:outer membrane lipid asymmetry maintenance protein MlaD [Paracoccaceae bacterium]
MSESTTEVLVGGAVLAVAIGFLIYAGQATGFSPAKSSDYPLIASFRSGEGISVGTDVRLAGVKIGTISQMALNAQTYRADVTLSMKQGILIPDDSAVVVASEGLLGGNFVEIYPGASLDNFTSGDEIEDTQGAVSLVSLLMKFVSGKDE